MEKEKTFAGFPSCVNPAQLQADIAVIGIPYGTPYAPEKTPHCLHAPEAIRRESNRYKDDPLAWDFDLNGTLLGDSSIQVVDCGNLPGSQNDPEGNRDRAQEAVASILAKNAIPLVLGGDDSVPIPVMCAYAGGEPFHVLQLDAHIDWRDPVGGVRKGYSSTMRRASELDSVVGIVQAGMRGAGSARTEERRAAANYGAEIVLAKTLMRKGSEAVLRYIPEGGRCFLTIDFDVLDPSVMPAVGAPTPGGLNYQTLIDIIHGAAMRTKIVGVCLVEFAPEVDLHNLSAVTAMRIAWNVIGALARV